MTSAVGSLETTSGAVVTGNASTGGVAGSVAGAGASVAGLGDSVTGCGASCAGVSSGGIPIFYRIAGSCLVRMAQRVEPFAGATISKYRRHFGR